MKVVASKMTVRSLNCKALLLLLLLLPLALAVEYLSAPWTPFLENGDVAFERIPAIAECIPPTLLVRCVLSSLKPFACTTRPKASPSFGSTVASANGTAALASGHQPLAQK